MYPGHVDSDEIRLHLGKRPLQLYPGRESPGSQESQQANGEECGSEEVPGPVAAQDFGAERYTLSCCGAEAAHRTCKVLGNSCTEVGSVVIWKGSERKSGLDLVDFRHSSATQRRKWALQLSLSRQALWDTHKKPVGVQHQKTSQQCTSILLEFVYCF